MAKGCKHISCLSITKLADRLSKDGITGDLPSSSPSEDASVQQDIWVCAVCLTVLPAAGPALAHSRKHNHQIFYRHLTSGDETTVSNGFYCSVCARDVEPATLTTKYRGVAEDAAKMIVEALKTAPNREPVILISGDGSSTVGASPQLNHAHGLRPSGLVNLGNTCFLNSALQALAAVLLTQEKRFPDDEIPSTGPIGTALLGTLKAIPITETATPSLVKKKSSRHGNIVEPSVFLGAISKRYKEFRRLRQQDSHDFLRLLFNALDDEHKEASKNQKQQQQIKALHQACFGGSQLSRVTCKACQTVTEVEEAFLDLSLAIPPVGELEGLVSHMRSLSTEDAYVPPDNDDTTLEDMLAFWARPSQLANENAFACEHCPREDETAKFMYRPAILQSWLKTLPPCLILHLQRFSVSGVGKRGIRLSKNHTQIAIPEMIDLAKFMPEGHRSRAQAGTKYRLTALVIHEGSSVDSGHYVAVMRYGDGGEWWYASDTSVKRISSPVGYNPYLVFYTLIDS